MPTSSNATTYDKRKNFQSKNQTKSIDQQTQGDDKTFLTIESALPHTSRRGLYKRSNSTLNSKANDQLPEKINLHTHTDGSLHVSRTQKEKEKLPDRISLDRKGLMVVPVLDNEPKLRLLSLQHNLINNLDGLTNQEFPCLVFLDIYDNQLEKITGLDKLDNLRVLLMGKNRIKKIENLSNIKRLEVLDLHGNQITQVCGLTALSELKVLNLAGNQIRIIGSSDLRGLRSLQELNLRRNKLKKLLGFSETTNLTKVFVSNNDLQSIEDVCNIAKSPTIKEITIDNNPLALEGDCMSFLVSYLPNLCKLNTLQITDHVRKTAMAWRRNKESTNTVYMDLASDVCLNVNREEVISNARTNWEFLRTQTKCVANKANTVRKSLKDLKPDSDFILTSLNKPNSVRVKARSVIPNPVKVPLLPDKKMHLARSSSQDTENSQLTSSSNNSNDFFRLPPILVPIIDKMEQKSDDVNKDDSLKLSGSLSSIGPNVDSSVSSLCSKSDSSSSSTSDSESDSEFDQCKPTGQEELKCITIGESTIIPHNSELLENKITTDSSSNISSETTNSNHTQPSTSGSETGNNAKLKITRNIRSATNSRTAHTKLHLRASTAKVKKHISPSVPLGAKDREQGGDYLIEICGRHLNIYGQGALRFIDRAWNAAKAHDVITVKFNYVNFNTATGSFSKLKQRFPNCENFIFKETNITCLGQLNALAEVQGLSSLFIDPEGNPITEKNWCSYAIFRLSHWGLKTINDKEITDDDIRKANEEYQSLSDLVLWSLPDVLLQPLLVRLRIDVNNAVTEHNAKKWLITADPALKSVVSKEALQWKKVSQAQEDVIMRQKAKQFLSGLLDEMAHAVNKLRLLEQEWPQILHEFVLNTLLDYSQMDLYMKKKLQELNNK